MQVDMVWRGARLATMEEGREGLGIVEPGLIAARGGRIVWRGLEAEAPRFEAGTVVDCEGRWITPGLVDCHTHLVFGGERIGEFRRRLAGERYEALANEGGIRASIAATRAASAAMLRESALVRLDSLLADGVTTVEIKSGYGQDEAAERRQLQVARGLSTDRGVRVHATYLALHAAPDGQRPDDYVAWVCDSMLPRVAAERLADSVDAFCEGIAFSPAQVERFFEAARGFGLRLRLHADQLSDLGGASLAANHGALSADHLEYTSEAGAAAMARSGTVAVLLPGAYFTLRETQPPPIDAFRRHGTRMAVATDLNPGTSPLGSLLLAMRMAATCFGLTIEECLLGVTREASKALGLWHETGSLTPGKSCDLAIWDINEPAELVYWLGLNRLHQRVFAGT